MFIYLLTKPIYQRLNCKSTAFKLEAKDKCYL